MLNWSGKLFITVLLITQGVQVKGEDLLDLAKDYQNIKKRIEEEEIKQRKTMSALFEINRKLKKVVAEKSDLSQEKLVIENQARDLARQILQTQRKLSEQKVVVKKRLLSMYRFGGQGAFRILFSSQSSAQLERNLKILSLVTKRDMGAVRTYVATVKELEKQKQSLSEKLAKIKRFEKKITNREERILAQNKAKSKLLDGIKQSKNYAMMKLEYIRNRSLSAADKDDERDLLDTLFRPSFFEQKGKLPHPVDGKVVQKFGVISDPQRALKWVNKGTLYKVPVRTGVRSVFDGRVEFLGEIPGYGKTLILDHGDHYYTVYGHNKNIKVQLGDEVKQNQVIAMTGGLSEEGSDRLYFEIRHFSEPNDPLQWVKGSQL